MSGLLDGVLLKLIQQAGVLFPNRRALNFTGSVTLTDDPANGATIVNVSSGSAGITGGDVIVTAGTAKAVGLQTVALAATTPLANQVPMMGASSYAPTSVENVLHVDTYIAAAGGNVTTGFQDAFSALATLSNATPGSPVLIIGPKQYAITAPITSLNMFACTIRGSGWQQSRILASPASGGTQHCSGLAVFQFVNSAYVTIQDVGIFEGNDYTTLTGNVIVGATTLLVTSGAQIVNGQKIGLQTASAAPAIAETVTVVSGGGTTTLTVTATRNAYSTSDYVLTGFYCGIQGYKDNSQSLGNGVTHMTIRNVAIGTFNTAGPIGGVSFDCNGGTGSASDNNNDINVLDHVQIIGNPAFGLNIGHSQCLANELWQCSMGGTTAVQTLTGGSWSSHGGAWGPSGMVATFGGVIGRSISMLGTVISDAACLLFEARASDSLSQLNINMIGCEMFGVATGTDLKLVNLTGSDFNLTVYGGRLAAGAGNHQLLFYFKDTGGSSVSSNVYLSGVELGVYGGTADGVLVQYDSGTSWTPAYDNAPHLTTLNGGAWLGMTSGSPNAGTLTPDRFGEIFGWIVSHNQVAKSTNYTVDSGSLLDETILVDNSSGAIAVTLPVQVRPGRPIKVIGLSTAHTITLTPQGGSLINGASSLVYTPGAVGQSVAVEGDGGTNWYSNGATSGGITALTGDGTASGSGSAAFTLATVNSNVGSFGGGANLATVTVNAKGQVTAASQAALASGNLPTITITGDTTGAASGGSIATTTEAITGNAGTVSIAATGAIMSWAATTSAPKWTQVAAGSDIATRDITISPQPPFASATVNKVSGNFVVNFAGNVAGYNANLNTFKLQTNGTDFLAFTPNGTGGNAYILAGGTSANKQLNIQGTALVLAATTSGMVLSANTGTTLADASQGHTLTYVGANAATLTYGNDITTSITDTQAALAPTSSASGTAGVPRAIQAQAGQAATGAAHDGGNGGVLALYGGAGGTSGSATAGVAGPVELHVNTAGVTGAVLAVNAAGSGACLAYAVNGVSVTTTTANPSPAPVIAFNGAVNASGCIISIPNQIGTYFLDFSDVTSVSNGITISTGAKSVVVTTLITTFKTLLIANVYAVGKLSVG